MRIVDDIEQQIQQSEAGTLFFVSEFAEKGLLCSNYLINLTYCYIVFCQNLHFVFVPCMSTKILKWIFYSISMQNTAYSGMDLIPLPKPKFLLEILYAIGLLYSWTKVFMLMAFTLVPFLTSTGMTLIPS